MTEFLSQLLISTRKSNRIGTHLFKGLVTVRAVTVAIKNLNLSINHVKYKNLFILYTTTSKIISSANNKYCYIW